MPNPITADCLADLAGIAHGFFTREGGVSTGIYEGLNCGVGSADDRSTVLANRERVARHLGTDGAKLLTCHQVHSATAVVVDNPWPLSDLPKADALVTRNRGIALGALAADCAPVLFVDLTAGVIGAAHAGWKGAVTGIIKSTIATMESIGAKRNRIRAALGPCIGPDAYEVGPEFEANVIALDPAAAQHFRRPPGGTRPYFDLPSYVLMRLANCGLDTIENCALCTYTNPHRLFSYRRSTHRREPDYGRQISAIVLR
jgi:YfiH family protein